MSKIIYTCGITNKEWNTRHSKRGAITTKEVKAQGVHHINAKKEAKVPTLHVTMKSPHFYLNLEKLVPWKISRLSLNSIIDASHLILPVCLPL